MTEQQSSVGASLSNQTRRLLAWLRILWTKLLHQLMRPRQVGKFKLATGVWMALVAIPILVWLMLMRPSATSVATAVIDSSAPAASPAGSSALPSLSETDFEVEVARIEMLKVYQRTERDWILLARGTAKLGRYEQSALAYQALLSLRADFRKDPGLLTDLLKASQDPKAFRIVLNLAESVLGKHGIDLIWEMWQRERYLPDRKEQADKLAKKLVILSLQASPALRVAIELTFFTNCDRLLSTLGRAASDADARSRPRLIELANKSGCGPAKSDDCFPCLRESPLLAQATERAKATLAPSLGATKEE
jgi:hypothetical protein